MNRILTHGWMSRALLGTLGLLMLVGPAWAQSSAADRWDQELGPVSIVTNDWVDVREILRSVAGNAGLGLQMAPDVMGGRQRSTWRMCPLSQALDAILKPTGLGYSMNEGVLVCPQEGNGHPAGSSSTIP